MLAAGGRELLAAISFLTRIPGSPPSDRPGAAAFALVGAGLGVLVAPALLLLPVSPLLAAGTVLAGLAILDGALHLDGVADSADALAAPTPEARERARRDPSVGAAGVVAIVVVVLLQVVSLAAVPPDSLLAAIVLAGAVSRSVPVVGAVLPIGSTTRLGGWWRATVRSRDAAACLGVSVALLVLPGARPLAIVSGLLLGLGALVVIARASGGANGDAYGASVELGFLGALVGSAL